MPQQPQGPHPYQHQYPPMPTASPKSPGVAAILSLVIPGLGHVYSGNPLSALMWFSLATLGWLTLGLVIGFVILPLAYIGASIHAYISTANFNSRHHVVR